MNQPPEILSLAITSPNFDDAYVYPVRAMDPDGDEISWELVSAPAGMVLDAQTGLLYGAKISPGNHPVSIRVSDENGGITEQTFTLIIPDNPVIYSIAPHYTFSGTLLRYKVSAFDPNKLKLIYSIALGPADMTIESDSGILQWNADVPGLFEIEISVANTLGKTARQTFTLTVLDEDDLAIISKPDTEGFVSQLYQYQLSVLIAEDTDFFYSLNSSPPGMAIDAESGLINWIPRTAGTYTVEIATTNAFGYMDIQKYDLLIYSLEEMDQVFNGIVDNLFQQLANGNIEEASQFLTAEAQSRLIPVFEELLPYMQSITENYSPPVRLTVNTESAEYITSRTQNGEERTFIITFVRNSSGEWKLHSM